MTGADNRRDKLGVWIWLLPRKALGGCATIDVGRWSCYIACIGLWLVGGRGSASAGSGLVRAALPARFFGAPP